MLGCHHGYLEDVTAFQFAMHALVLRGEASEKGKPKERNMYSMFRRGQKHRTAMQDSDLRPLRMSHPPFMAFSVQAIPLQRCLGFVAA